MPNRETPLENNFYYHVYNRGINKQITFNKEPDYFRAHDLARYYSSLCPKKEFSSFIKLSKNTRDDYWKKVIDHSDKLVKFICYCLMPNHFHFILKQNVDNGISKFMADFQNSYTRYFNTKNNKFGPIFQGRFKSELIDNDRYLLHLSRYIHLNPYSSKIVNSKDKLFDYPWSSFQEYISNFTPALCTTKLVLDHFKDQNSYIDFVLERADEQRELEMLKHLVIEDE